MHSLNLNILNQRISNNESVNNPNDEEGTPDVENPPLYGGLIGSLDIPRSDIGIFALLLVTEAHILGELS
jgi:hypothetical protein